MTLQVVGKDVEKGPLDDAARALLEKILALKPLAIAIVYETAVMRDFDCIPNLEMIQNGLASTIAGILEDRRGEE